MKMFNDESMQAWTGVLTTLVAVLLGLVVIVVYEEEAGVSSLSPEGTFEVLLAFLLILAVPLFLYQRRVRSRWLVVKTLLLGIFGIGVAGLFVWLNEPAVGHELYFTIGVMALLHALFTFLVLYLPWTGRFRKRQK